MATIFHLAVASDWRAAQAVGLYTISTRGRTLAQEGFIHASRGDQWPGVRSRYYADLTEPLLLLQIDTDLLDVPLIEEPNVPGGDNYPHIYGPLPVSAVVRAIPLDSAGPAAQPEPQPQPEAERESEPTYVGPPPSFSRIFLQEMFFNAGMLLLAMLVAFAGLAIGAGIDAGQGGRAGSIGGLAGLAAGVVLARLLYVRRHRARAGNRT